MSSIAGRVIALGDEDLLGGGEQLLAALVARQPGARRPARGAGAGGSGIGRAYRRGERFLAADLRAAAWVASGGSPAAGASRRAWPAARRRARAGEQVAVRLDPLEHVRAR